MKKILLLALLYLLNVQVEASDKKTFLITGTIPDKFNGKEVTLSVIQNDSLQPLSVDTIQNAAFSFKGNMYLEQVAIVRLNDPEHDYSAEVFLEAGNIQVSLDSISHVKGTFLNDLYATYLSESQKRITIAEKEYQANIEGKENPQTERFESLKNEYAAYISKFQIDNINNAVGKHLYIKEIGRFWDPLFWENYEQLPPDIKSHPNVQLYCTLRQEIDQTQKQIEQKIKDVPLHTMDSCKVLLSDYLKDCDYLYVDIWASWCVPCIQELPKIKSIREKYKGKGLKVILVSIDTKFSSWIHAIYEHAPEFDHLIDLTGGETLKQTFSFALIPHGILLNHDGTIIANKLENVSLKKKLKELYGE
ncbi:MAG: AhpC/TSA family protein [Parabacteroides sp.]|nr:AhpC/TSA family protein [Parabacteroides sp.]